MSKNKLNNILTDLNINDGISSEVVENTHISDIQFDNISNFNTNNYILNNSLIISKFPDETTAYNLYYKGNSELNLMTYIIKEGNGLYNYDSYNALFFNIDDYSIKEAYNKIFVNTNFITVSNDEINKFGISKIDLSYLINKENAITVNNQIVLDFIETRNKLNELKQKCIDIYNKISYYDNIIQSHNDQIDKKVIYNYKDIEIKYKDNYYFNGILRKEYKDYYVTLDEKSNMIYYKNINSVDIRLELESDYAYNLVSEDINEKYVDDIYTYNYIYTYNEIYPSLKKFDNDTFILLNSSFSKKISKLNENHRYVIDIPGNRKQINTYINTTYNSVFLNSNSLINQQLLKKYGGKLKIDITPNTISYIDKKYINKYSLLYDIDSSSYNISYSYMEYNYINKYIPTRDTIKMIYDNRDIKYGNTFYNENIKNSYLAFFDEYFGVDISIDLTNPLINKLIDHNIIWYNYDEVLHYGYNILYINDKNNKYHKKYIPIWQNISTKIINYKFFIQYLNSKNNINLIDIDNTISLDMNTYIYDKNINTRNIYVYKIDFENGKITHKINTNYNTTFNNTFTI